MNDLTETICALSTAPGRSGLAVVRVSGPESLSLLNRLFWPRKGDRVTRPRVAVLGKVVDPRSGLEIDEAIATYFPGPNSYTGEDVTEYSIHGSPVLINALLDALCALGARLAGPGEFTMRAFLNGKIDLTQAEAICDIIEATTLFQAQVAARQRRGELSQRLKTVKELVIDVMVNLESAVEFAEEELALDTREQATEKIAKIQSDLRELIDSFRKGRLVRDGFNMAVVGRPNVGKSSIFNALLSQDRSIVAETPGTTRDLVSEYTSIGGIPVRLLDTAGIQDAQDKIEKLGIDRSYRAISEADAILLVVDTSRPLGQPDWELRQELDGLSCIVVMNKSDLPSCWSAGERVSYSGSWPCVEVSAKTGSGISSLRKLILDHLLGEASMHRDGILVTNLRHCRHMQAAEELLGNAATALTEGLSEEFALVDLRRSLNELGAITGETQVEDLLDEIFSRFCIGK